ncbi:MAG: hypothetical protein RIQ75_2231 [Pseudomonadota bacterium]|jgi:uncharacterized protein YdcH (DUF465 family)
MSHTPNDLRDEFPEAVDVLHQLKIHDAHFAKLADTYHDLNREIHRIESDLEPASDARAEALKKQRLALLDDISAIVAKAKAA